MKKVGVILFFAVLVLSIGFVFAYSSFIDGLLNSGAKVLGSALFDNQGNLQSGTISLGDSENNIGEIVNPDAENLDISAKAVDVSKSAGLTTVSFTSNNSLMKLNGDAFENIDSQKSPAYLTLDGNGEIIKADFMTNENGGDYNLGGVKFKLEPNSRVVYDKEKGLQLPDDSSILDSLNSGIVSGNNIKLANGKIISGIWKYSNGNMLVSSGDLINLNGLDIINNKNLDNKDLSVFFDGEKHSGRYISLGENNIYMASPDYEGPSVNFLKDNPYLKIEDNDYVSIQLKKDADIFIQNRDSSGLIPKFVGKGYFILDEGSKSFIYKEGLSYLSVNPERASLGSSPLDVYFGDKRMIIDNSNRFGYDIPKTFDYSLGNVDGSSNNQEVFSHRLKYNYHIADWTQGTVDRGIYLKIKQNGMYVNNARELYLDKALQKKYPNVDFTALKQNAPTNDKLLEYVNNIGNYYLTTQERDAALKGTEYESYAYAMGDLKHLYWTISPTYGNIEGGIPTDDENYGLRQSFYKWYSE